MSFRSCVYSLVKKHERENFALQLKKGAEKDDKDNNKITLDSLPDWGGGWGVQEGSHTSIPLINVFPLFDNRLIHCKNSHSISPGPAGVVKMKEGWGISSRMGCCLPAPCPPIYPHTTSRGTQHTLTGSCGAQICRAPLQPYCDLGLKTRP